MYTMIDSYRKKGIEGIIHNMKIDEEKAVDKFLR